MLEVKQISPKEILQKKLGPLSDLEDWRGLNDKKRVKLVFKYRTLISEFIKETMEEGWDFKGAYEFDKIPYGGSFVFVREGEKDGTDRFVNLFDDKFDQLVEKYEQETDKNAIYHGRITKQFKKWMKDESR